MTFKTIRQVAEYRSLSRCGMEEIAVHQITAPPSGGILFARNPNGDQKAEARAKAVELFHPDNWPGNLRILTMPGLHWHFERQLLGLREDGWYRKMRKGPARTHFTCVENDRAIYLASVTRLPGITSDNPLKQTALPFAEMGIKTKFAAFYFANVDDFLGIDFGKGWGAAWLDYTGPLSIDRMRKIKRFYEKYIQGILVITALKARWNKETSRAIEKAGGHSQWVRRNLEGDILHDLEYFDTSPMAQIAFRKPGP